MTAILLAALLSGSVAHTPSVLTPSLSCSGCLVQATGEVPPDRVRELRAEIRLLDDRIRHLEVAWPPAALGLATVGYVLTPMLAIALIVAVVAAVLAGDPSVNTGGIWVTAAVFGVLGGVGLVSLVAGITMGVRGVEEKKSQKEEWRHQKESLEAELQELTGRTALRSRPLPVLASVGFRF